MVKKASKKKVAKKKVQVVEKVEVVVEPVVKSEPTPEVKKDAGYSSRRRMARGWQ